MIFHEGTWMCKRPEATTTVYYYPLVKKATGEDPQIRSVILMSYDEDNDPPYYEIGTGAN